MDLHKPVDEMDPAELVAEIKRLSSRVPPAFQDWGIERTRDFKNAVSHGRRLVESGNRGRHLLSAALKALRGFW